jgi:2-amino-4-hydroxy-6-hydroxymethyldihydropteridine diphosphokinase
MDAKLHKTAIALGGNLGDSAANFDFAVKSLENNGLKNIKLSDLISSKPENCPEGSPDFTNAALTGEWEYSAHALLELCQKIEIQAGRPVKHGFNTPRILDLDIILFDTDCLDKPDLKIPHPRAAERIFVLEPLAQIAPNWIFPDSGKKVKELLEILKSSSKKII